MHHLDYLNTNISPFKSIDHATTPNSKTISDSRTSTRRNFTTSQTPRAIRNPFFKEFEFGDSPSLSNNHPTNLKQNPNYRDPKRKHSISNSETKKRENNKIDDDSKSFQSTSKYKSKNFKNEDYGSFYIKNPNYFQISNRKSNKLVCDNTISIQHFYIEDENTSIPYQGKLISLLNNSPILSKKQKSQNECHSKNFDSTQLHNSPANNKIESTLPSNDTQIKETPLLSKLNKENQSIDSNHKFSSNSKNNSDDINNSINVIASSKQPKFNSNKMDYQNSLQNDISTKKDQIHQNRTDDFKMKSNQTSNDTIQNNLNSNAGDIKQREIDLNLNLNTNTSDNPLTSNKNELTENNELNSNKNELAENEQLNSNKNEIKSTSNNPLTSNTNELSESNQLNSNKNEIKNASNNPLTSNKKELSESNQLNSNKNEIKNASNNQLTSNQNELTENNPNKNDISKVNEEQASNINIDISNNFINNQSKDLNNSDLIKSTSKPSNVNQIGSDILNNSKPNAKQVHINTDLQHEQLPSKQSDTIKSDLNTDKSNLNNTQNNADLRNGKLDKTKSDINSKSSTSNTIQNASVNSDLVNDKSTKKQSDINSKSSNTIHNDANNSDFVNDKSTKKQSDINLKTSNSNIIQNTSINSDLRNENLTKTPSDIIQTQNSNTNQNTSINSDLANDQLTKNQSDINSQSPNSNDIQNYSINSDLSDLNLNSTKNFSKSPPSTRHPINDFFLNINDRETLKRYKFSKKFAPNQSTNKHQLNIDSFINNIKPEPFESRNRSVSMKSPTNDELQYVPKIKINIKDQKQKSTKKRPKSVSNRTEALLSNLFVDDGIPISFFDFDFATSYVVENIDAIPEIQPKNYFPSIAELETQEATENLNKKQIKQIIEEYFLPGNELDKTFSLTSLIEPLIYEFKMNPKTNQIDLISANDFFSFCLGKASSKFSPDRLHIFTWHNLGIPANQIAKNLILYIQSPTDRNDPQIKVKAAIQYILIWIKYFPTDFNGTSHRLTETFAQLTKILQSMSNEQNKAALNILSILIDQLSTKQIKPEDFSQHLSKPSFKKLVKFNQLISLTVDPDILITHLTFLDLQMLHKLQRIEFVKSNWKNNPDISHNFQIMMKRFNDTVQFVISSILVDSVKRRARNISYWIKMMYLSQKNRNYHLLAIIDSALSSLPIMRLNDSWSHVNENALLAFLKLHNYFRKKENQKEAFNNPSTTIPFIGTFIVQLDQFNEKNYSTDFNGQMAYNLDIQRKSISVIEEIFLPWGVGLNFELDKNLLKQCIEFNGTINDPNEMLDISLKYDPMKNSEKTILEQFISKT